MLQCVDWQTTVMFWRITVSLSSGSCLAGQEDEGIMTLGNVTNYLPVKKKKPIKSSAKHSQALFKYDEMFQSEWCSHTWMKWTKQIVILEWNEQNK